MTNKRSRRRLDRETEQQKVSDRELAEIVEIALELVEKHKRSPKFTEIQEVLDERRRNALEGES